MILRNYSTQLNFRFIIKRKLCIKLYKIIICVRQQQRLQQYLRELIINTIIYKL